MSKERIDVECDGQMLPITGDGGRRVYNEQIQLPAQVNGEAVTASYNNGVVAVTLPHETDDTGTTISID